MKLGSIDLRQDNEGFTLIEMVVVLGILGLLIGIVAMSVSHMPLTARSRAKGVEQHVVDTAIQAYLVKDSENGVAPPLSARAEDDAARITPADAEVDAQFAKYLRRSTKFEYWWEVTSGPSVSVTLHQID